MTNHCRHDFCQKKYLYWNGEVGALTQEMNVTSFTKLNFISFIWHDMSEMMNAIHDVKGLLDGKKSSDNSPISYLKQELTDMCTNFEAK